MGIAPVWIGSRGVSIGPRHGSMQSVTWRNENGHRPTGSGAGSLGGARGSFERAPLSVRTRTRSLEAVARWLETVSGRKANETFPKQRRSPSIGAAPVSSRRSPFSTRSGHGCFGPEPSSIRFPSRPMDGAPAPKEKLHGRIEEDPVSIEPGAIRIRRARVSIGGGGDSIEPCRFSIERGSFSIQRGRFSIGGVPFSTRRTRMPRNRERFARLHAKTAGDGEPCWPGTGGPPRPSR